MDEFYFLWISREKKVKNGKYLIIVGTKNSGVSPLLELKNLESVHHFGSNYYEKFTVFLNFLTYFPQNKKFNHTTIVRINHSKTYV